MNTLSVARSQNLQPVDPIWTAIRDEATEAVERDPLLAAFLYSTILNQESLEDAVIHRLAERLDHQDLGADIIRQSFHGDAEGQSGMELDRPRRHPGLLRPRSGLRPLPDAGALLQGFPCDPDAPAGPLALQ